MHREVGDGSLKSFDNHRRNVSAAVAPVVNYKGLLCKLRIVVFHKFVQTRYSHVRNVDVTNFSVGCLGNLAGIFGNPAEVAESRLVCNWFNKHFSGSFKCRFCINLHLNNGSGSSNEVFENIPALFYRLAID